MSHDIYLLYLANFYHLLTQNAIELLWSRKKPERVMSIIVLEWRRADWQALNVMWNNSLKCRQKICDSSLANMRTQEGKWSSDMKTAITLRTYLFLSWGVTHMFPFGVGLGALDVDDLDPVSVASFLGKAESFTRRKTWLIEEWGKHMAKKLWQMTWNRDKELCGYSSRMAELNRW